MAKVRLFANLREIAGTARLEIDGGTVREIIDGANEPVAIYNLTDNDLGNAGKYAALRDMLVGFAQGN